ncbi:MAG TPA: hypothetical protein VN602_03965 [Gemmatimonadaceae bacterium]|nr:hypothetical protein [Gemmatimonadaceae bacterium]
MPAYHQMGHDSENLLLDSGLTAFGGMIISPVNYSEPDVAAQIAAIRAVDEKADFDIVFDPQLYFPHTERGCLREWSYFPSDVDTADRSADSWWQSMITAIVPTIGRLHVDAVCSPAEVPRAYPDAYFAHAVDVGNMLADALRDTNIRPLQTAIIGLAELSTPRRALAVASIISATRCEGVYLVFVGSTEPRRELAHVEELKGAMRLIHALEREANLPVLVGFTSTDAVLWKAAGASSVATGKFFNLRRFTLSRFEEPGGGGGQLPYWVEESLLAFLRESDITRVRGQNILSVASNSNPFGQRILERLAEQPGKAWVALGWRQFMHWFADVEDRIESRTADVRTMLREAEINWRDLEDADVLMEEQRNDGTWLRAWRRALAEYLTH